MFANTRKFVRLIVRVYNLKTKFAVFKVRRISKAIYDTLSRRCISLDQWRRNLKKYSGKLAKVSVFMILYVISECNPTTVRSSPLSSADTFVTFSFTFSCNNTKKEKRGN